MQRTQKYKKFKGAIKIKTFKVCTAYMFVLNSIKTKNKIENVRFCIRCKKCVQTSCSYDTNFCSLMAF